MAYDGVCKMLVKPWLRRKLVDPIWAATRKTPVRDEWHELERTQYLPLSELADRQQTRLRALMAAAETAPFYAKRLAEAGVSAHAIKTVADLSKLPLLTKADIRTRRDELLTSGSRPTDLMEFRTGGSTGTPLVVYAKEEVSERRNACTRRCNRWTGWEVGEPVGAVWGNPKLPSTLKEHLHYRLLSPVVYLDTMALDAESVRRFARDWRRVRPTLLFGHAHSIYLLACHVRDLGIDAIQPKAIIATSMMLIAPERQVIEQVFGIKVFDRYGCEEVGLIGCECERHAGMHINMDHLVTEFVRENGDPAADGEMAFVVVTDLLNHAMPLIRYRVEDMAERTSRACDCGRGLPLMDRVAGRLADFLVRADGARVAGISLIENTLTNIPGLEQMQIVQHELDRIELRVVPTAAFGPEHRRELTKYFEATFPGARVELQDVAALARESNGKYRFAICRVQA